MLGGNSLAIVNLVLCVIITVLGYAGYKKNKDKASLNIGLAFALFGISHVMAIIGMMPKFETAVGIIRFFAYLIIAYALADAMRD